MALTAISYKDSGFPAEVAYRVDEREEWRRHSVLTGLGGMRVVGKGFEGYREALNLLAERRP